MSEFKKLRGAEIAKLFYESQAAAVDRIEEIQASEKIACDFRRLDGYLFQGHGMPADIIDQELEAVKEVGAPVHRLVGVPLKGCESRHVLRYPRQATFHPLKYLAGLPRFVRRTASVSSPTVLSKRLRNGTAPSRCEPHKGRSRPVTP
jgi:glycine/D-amino acid oxidase-like deaminating enzyme